MTENERAPMNEAEKELCGQLADALFLRCNDDDSWSQTAREKLLPIIRSYANALVAAAVSECAKSLSVYFAGTTLEFYANHIHSAVTPKSAAKELERIKAEARLEEAKWWWGMFTDGAPAVCDKRIAALEAAKEK